VPQLHIHHIARFKSDPAWPAPVWGKLPAIPYTDEQIKQLKAHF
jgi:diadenosine tetraphosphate (Ap4A) HIT family hydrolase